MLKYLILTVFCLFLHRVNGDTCKTGSSGNCPPPDCICSSTYPPDGLNKDNVTQMIILVFEGSLSTANYPTYYKPIFDSLPNNSNNCPPRATFFIDHEYTDYTIVNKAWYDGHDIGVQSITGIPFTGEDEATIQNEILGEAYYIAQFAQLNSTVIQGVRAPQTASGGNNQFDAITAANMLYDASLVTRSYAYPYWPYTLDWQTTQDCTNGPCPSKSYPGLFEFPVTDFIDGNGQVCNNLVQCIYNISAPDAYSLLENNYKYHQAQKAPYIIPIPLSWLTINSTNVDGLIQFLKESMTAGAFVVTMNQAVAWFKQPTIDAEINNFDPWKCDVSRGLSPCIGYTCNYNFTNQYVSMGYCTSADQPSCPTDYPWINNLPF